MPVDLVPHTDRAKDPLRRGKGSRTRIANRDTFAGEIVTVADAAIGVSHQMGDAEENNTDGAKIG